MLLELPQQNTQLTEMNQDLIQRIESLTPELHDRLCHAETPKLTRAADEVTTRDMVILTDSDAVPLAFDGPRNPEPPPA